ncbi:MAG: serine/threonine-protein kinase [Gemmataceae bacterium]
MQVLCSHCQYSGDMPPSNDGTVVCPGCGSSIRNERGTTVGWVPANGQRRFGRFELIEAVGSGSFGTVFEARDTELDRIVAIKVPRSDRMTKTPGEAERFLREARSVAQFNHQSIVSIHDVGELDGAPYLVEDFVRGITLTDLLTGERLQPRQIAEIVAQVADALQYAHDRGVIHRDIKPSNIMLERGAQGEYLPKLMDFGLAKRDSGDETLTLEGQVLGTPAYMSPEQARGDNRRVDGRSDVYGLGGVLYHLLTGQTPFKGNPRMMMHHVMHDDPRPPRKIDPRIPADLQTICLRAMAEGPRPPLSERRRARDDLRRWLTGEPILARPAGRLERTVKWVRRRPERAALLSLILILLIGGAALGAWLWLREPPPPAEPPVVAPVADVPPTDVERLFNALVKPLVKIDCVLTADAPLHLARKSIPASVLEIPARDGKPRFHDGPLYFSLSGAGAGHSLDLTDQPGQAAQITHFGGEISVTAPYLLFVGNLAPSSRVYIKGGPGFSILAPMNGGLGSKHVEFDGTHFLMPKLGEPHIDINAATPAERAGLRNPDLTQKAVWKYDVTEYVIFFRPGAKIVTGNHEQRKKDFPEIYEIIELDRRRQNDAPRVGNDRLQQALREAKAG